MNEEAILIDLREILKKNIKDITANDIETLEFVLKSLGENKITLDEIKKIINVYNIYRNIKDINGIYRYCIEEILKKLPNNYAIMVNWKMIRGKKGFAKSKTRNKESDKMVQDILREFMRTEFNGIELASYLGTMEDKVVDFYNEKFERKGEPISSVTDLSMDTFVRLTRRFASSDFINKSFSLRRERKLASIRTIYGQELKTLLYMSYGIAEPGIIDDRRRELRMSRDDKFYGIRVDKRINGVALTGAIKLNYVEDTQNNTLYAVTRGLEEDIKLILPRIKEFFLERYMDYYRFRLEQLSSTNRKETLPNLYEKRLENIFTKLDNRIFVPLIFTSPDVVNVFLMFKNPMWDIIDGNLYLNYTSDYEYKLDEEGFPQSLELDIFKRSRYQLESMGQLDSSITSRLIKSEDGECLRNSITSEGTIFITTKRLCGFLGLPYIMAPNIFFMRIMENLIVRMSNVWKFSADTALLEYPVRDLLYNVEELEKEVGRIVSEENRLGREVDQATVRSFYEEISFEEYLVLEYCANDNNYEKYFGKLLPSELRDRLVGLFEKREDIIDRRFINAKLS